MSCCCSDAKPEPEPEGGGCCSAKRSVDWLLWGSLAIILFAYGFHFWGCGMWGDLAPLQSFSHGVYELMNKLWWGVAMGIVAVGVMHQIPREAVLKVIGKPGTVSGLLRAMLGGLCLDLCNHGILLVGMKLYERGASLGQVFAFLIASPWNSFSVTLILVALIGFPLTGLFILASAVIAFITGWLVDRYGVHPSQGNSSEVDTKSMPGKSWSEVWAQIRENFPARSKVVPTVIRSGLRESRMILRWVFFGAVLAAAIRAFIDPQTFQEWFGPSLAGMLLTLVAATIIEVCSEGSTPVGADLVTRAHAPGNGFVFLMAGAATDYTEVMALKETTERWSHALLLPALTVPQVLVIGYLINRYSGSASG